VRVCCGRVGGRGGARRDAGEPTFVSGQERHRPTPQDSPGDGEPNGRILAGSERPSRLRQGLLRGDAAPRRLGGFPGVVPGGVRPCPGDASLGSPRSDACSEGPPAQ
ncbi:unnamed protein product, partial [Ectocarpus fasciculatus]